MDNCRRQGLFKSGDRVIAACSGGADSMALLLFLLRNRRKLAIEVLATHVNHGIRGETARRDADFVADFCRRNGVELFLYDAVQEGIDVPPNPSEDWARGLRYGWFDELAAREEAVIATAHTMSDQAETVLFRIARGTGLHGLAGIPSRRGCYVRPCLCLTRADTEAYCAALGQHYVQDETNAEDTYARNRIRHEAVPALQYANPAAERSIARLCRQMRALDDWLNAEAAALLQAAAVPGGYDVAILRRAEGPVLDAALHALVSPVRDAEEKYIRLLSTLVEQGSGAVQLTGSVRFCAGGGVLWMEEMPTAAAPDDPAAAVLPLPFDPAGPLEIALPGGWMLAARQIPGGFQEKTQGVHKKDLKNQADYAKIIMLYSALTLRCRQPGDTFRPAGRGIRKELRKWMNEAGIPPEERDRLPLLAAGSEVVWVCGAGFADGLAPTADSENVLQMEAQKMEEQQ